MVEHKTLLINNGRYTNCIMVHVSVVFYYRVIIININHPMKGSEECVKELFFLFDSSMFTIQEGFSTDLMEVNDNLYTFPVITL